MDHEDERLKALLTTVGEQPGPPLGFTADGIARRGRRVRLARWGAGVAAGLVAAGTITTAVVLAANPDLRPGTPPPPPITSTGVPTTPDDPATTKTTVTTTVTVTTTTTTTTPLPPETT